MAVTYNTTIDQGADWFITFIYENPNGTAVNITNYTAALQIRTSPLAKTTVLSLTNGNGKYAYDLEITAPTTNVVTRLVQGTVEVSPQVTRT